MIFKIIIFIVCTILCLLSFLSVMAEARANKLVCQKLKEIEEKTKMTEISASLNAELIRNYIDIQEKKNTSTKK